MRAARPEAVLHVFGLAATGEGIVSHPAPADSRAAFPARRLRALRRRPLPAPQARLRRILRPPPPRHPLRPPGRSAGRVRPRVAAARSALALRLAARARIAGGTVDHRVPGGPGLVGGRVVTAAGARGRGRARM
jgi:hypothetical protein